MKLLYQFTQKNPSGWIEGDAASWAGAAKRPQPVSGALGGEDNTEGWIHCLNCQGICFYADHYRVEEQGENLIITVWEDDEEDYPSGAPEDKVAYVWTIKPLRTKPKLNTDQTLVIYAEPNRYARFTANPTQTTGGPVIVLPWSEFIAPADDSKTKHGIWTTNNKNDEHRTLQTHRGYREWKEVKQRTVVAG